MTQLLTYGLHVDGLKHISAVSNGLGCNCVCPCCQHLLVAKNNLNNKMEHHFAHYKGMECKGAVETALHLLAKDVFLKTKTLRTPDFHYDYNPQNLKSKYKDGRLLHFENVVLEQRIQIGEKTIIPDAIGNIGNKTVYIEFANTHFLEEDKREELRRLNVACIEVDISEQELNEDKLSEFFQSKSAEIYWTQNPRLDTKYRREKDHKKKLKDWKRDEKKKKRKLKNEQAEKLALETFKKHELNPKLKVSGSNSSTNTVSQCPKREFKYRELRNSNFYKHPVLKRILDGEFWNGEIYGRMPNAKHIYLGGEKLEVYPKEVVWNRCDLNQQQYCKTFYAGLKRIQAVQNDFSLGRCGVCPSAQVTFTFQNRFYSMCNFSST